MFIYALIEYLPCISVLVKLALLFPVTVLYLLVMSFSHSLFSRGFGHVTFLVFSLWLSVPVPNAQPSCPYSLCVSPQFFALFACFCSCWCGTLFWRFYCWFSCLSWSYGLAESGFSLFPLQDSKSLFFLLLLFIKQPLFLKTCIWGPAALIHNTFYWVDNVIEDYATNATVVSDHTYNWINRWIKSPSCHQQWALFLWAFSGIPLVWYRPKLDDNDFVESIHPCFRFVYSHPSAMSDSACMTICHCVFWYDHRGIVLSPQLILNLIDSKKPRACRRLH